eukprot:5796934-Pleurochrysis_carterae.AAC.1
MNSRKEERALAKLPEHADSSESMDLHRLRWPASGRKARFKARPREERRANACGGYLGDGVEAEGSDVGASDGAGLACSRGNRAAANVAAGPACARQRVRTVPWSNLQEAAYTPFAVARHHLLWDAKRSGIRAATAFAWGTCTTCALPQVSSANTTTVVDCQRECARMDVQACLNHSSEKLADMHWT